MEEIFSDAVKALREGCYQEALEKCIQVATRWPSYKDTVRAVLLKALSEVLNQMLEMEGPSSPLFRHLVRSLAALYSTDILVTSVLGAKCLKEGALKEAKLCLSAALTIDPYHLSSHDNMATLKSQLVPRWHFKMLNDIARNTAYFRAVTSAVRALPHCTVLDIGSGTGLLSMMALRSGAESVYACEVNETLAVMSCDIISTNRMEGQVSVINCFSNNLTVPDTLPQRVSLVVTETVDAGLLGEWIIPTLRHAWTELLLPRDLGDSPNPKGASGHVIPCSATVFVTLIECSEIRKQTRLVSSSVGGIGLECVRLEGSCHASSPGDRRQGGPCLSSNGDATIHLTRDPYMCERLSRVKRGYRELTATTTALEFDFTHPQIPLPPSRTISLPITAEGTGDALAVWFTLHLDDTHSITTSPSEDTSWDQAVFPLATSISVRVGDEALSVHASCSDCTLKICLTESASSIESSVFVDRGDLLRLNDGDYISSYHRAITAAVRHMLSACEACDGFAKCVVLDCSHGFSLSGPIAALEGADFVMVSQLPLMYHSVMSEILASNKLTEQVSIRNRSGTELVQTGVLWDIVVCDVVSPQGTLYTDVLEELETLSSACTPKTLFLPSSVSLHMVLISSPALRGCSSVLGTFPTLGFNVASHMNHYQVTHHTDLDLPSLPHTTLSEHTHTCTMTLGKSSHVDEVVCVRVTGDGTLTGMAYWFKLHLHDNITIDTGLTDTSGHWHHSVFMLSEDMCVKSGDKVKVHVVIRDSCVLLELYSDS